MWSRQMRLKMKLDYSLEFSMEEDREDRPRNSRIMLSLSSSNSRRLLSRRSREEEWRCRAQSICGREPSREVIFQLAFLQFLQLVTITIQLVTRLARMIDSELQTVCYSSDTEQEQEYRISKPKSSSLRFISLSHRKFLRIMRWVIQLWLKWKDVTEKNQRLTRSSTLQERRRAGTTR